ncbi:DUF983 domain-containing protein [Fontibacter flavus]|uniref:DUF983 domain-containing protein n=1 Tax=Fontibacter flavus TaxID=654838 RepID=A0ABV6FR07_9BACT|nr:DUF983 domain-containing protein [Cyclobacteriaceae bacterium]
MNKKSLGAAMLQGKCPSCREGNIFPTPIFSFRKLTEVHHRCPKCQAVFTPEPDFYYGAMFISYAFSVALMVTVFTAINILTDNAPLSAYLITIVVSNVLLLPLMLKYSKVLYLYWLGKLKYDPEKAKAVK